MADMLQKGAAWLAGKLRDHVSREVVYVRGAGQSGEIRRTMPATVGRTRYEVTDELGGVRLEYTDRDFLIVTEEFRAGGLLEEPQEGDRVEEAVGGATLVYEVAPPPGRTAWRYDDPYRTMIRVHTKQIEA